MKPSRQPTFQTRLLTAAVLACFAAGAQANPVGPAVVSGTASFAQQGSTLTVTNSHGAIINWQGFSINANETTRFVQPSAASSVLNRVVTQDPSTLLGNLQSNGKVFLINPAGIMVGQGARIDVAGFVASTLQLSDQDFLAGKLNFTATPNAGNLSNAGAITTPTGGSVYLVGPNVENSGVIQTPAGETILAAGQTVQLIDTSTPGVKVEITGERNQATNLGQIVAESGRIGVAGVLIKNSGTLNANSVVSEGGRIFLRATKDTMVDGDSRISATGSKGGQIEVLGQRVAVMGTSQLDASGSQGGGSVLVGGDYQGNNPDVQNAQVSYFGPQATIKADATDSGDGGKVIVWSDDTTRAYGKISARGGMNGGNGGFVETSGKHYLDVGAIQVDRSAPAGKAGAWLLDPTNVTIDLAPTVEALGGGTFDPYTPGLVFENATSNPTILWSTITGNLASGPVMITTTGSGGVGNIFFAGGKTYNYSSTNDLWFVANQDIYGAGITLANSGTGALRFIAGWSGASVPAAPNTFDYSLYNVTAGTGSLTFLGSNVSTMGAIQARAGSDITVKVAFPTGNSSASLLANGNMDLETYGNLIVANEPLSPNTGNAEIRANGNQTISLKGTTSNLTVSAYNSGSGYGGLARLSANGTQTISFSGSGAHLLQVLGGKTFAPAGSYATIEAAGTQSITHSAGTLGISVIGGDVTSNILDSYKDFGLPTQQLICTACATHNSANIQSKAGQTITASNITLTGGSGGNGNWAGIEADGAQNIATTGAISITGGASGGAYYPAFGWDGYNSNDAGISSDVSTTINAASIALTSGGASYGGAYLGGPTVNITTSGNVTLDASAGISSGGAYSPPNPLPTVFHDPAAIGYDKNTASITLNVGGNLALIGGAMGLTGGSPALIGSLNGAAAVTANVQGGITLGASPYTTFIGSWNNLGGSVALTSGIGGTGALDLGAGMVGTGSTGSVLLDAQGTGGSIGQPTGVIRTGSLAATAKLGIALTGGNQVGTVSAVTDAGNINFNNTQSFHVTNMWAKASTGNITLTTTAAPPAAIDVGLGTLTAGTSGTLAITTTGGMFDDNGGGVTNLKGQAINLISYGSILPTTLAISMDVEATNSLTASVGPTATYGDISIRSLGAQPGSITIGSQASSQGNIDFFQSGALSLGAGTSFNSTVGNLALGASGPVTLGSFTPGIVAGRTMNVSTPGDMTVTGNVSSAGDLKLAAANLTMQPGSLLSSAYNIYAYVGGNILINEATVSAGNTVDIALNGATSTLTLNDAAYANPAEIHAGSAVVPSIKIDLPGRSSGGIVLDGVETLTTVAGGSGFFVSGSPAIQGSNLLVSYGLTNNVVANLLAASVTSISSDPGTAANTTTLPLPVDSTAGTTGLTTGSSTDTIGGTAGSFGGDGNGGDSNGQDDSAKKKNGEAGGQGKDKKYGQCS